jgi:nucleoid-associated protein YgaU
VANDTSSRHRNLPTYNAGSPPAGGVLELYVPRVAEPQERALLHKVAAGDRLDLLSARYFGDPFQYWRIVDANPAFRPEELLEPGRVLIIPRRP